ncbi:hypothetical protein N0V82_001468 [Gnomoniopsis sp. IMI 355080]|nr:hypothetical protein N0V82_001468 [Gnomoniopsis sp. IMI 355080]
MKALIDELPPHNIWQKHTHGTSLADYPISKYSISQSNPLLDRSLWMPPPAFYDYAKVQSGEHPSTLTNKVSRRQEGNLFDSESYDGTSSPVRSRTSKIRGNLENLLGVRCDAGGNKRVKESNLLVNPNTTKSLIRRLSRSLRRKLKGLRSTEDKDVDFEDEIQTKSNAKAKGKRRESEPESEDDESKEESVANEYDFDTDEWDWDMTLFLPVDEYSPIDDRNESDQSSHNNDNKGDFKFDHDQRDIEKHLADLDRMQSSPRRTSRVAVSPMTAPKPTETFTPTDEALPTNEPEVQ